MVSLDRRSGFPEYVFHKHILLSRGFVWPFRHCIKQGRINAETDTFEVIIALTMASVGDEEEAGIQESRNNVSL